MPERFGEMDGKLGERLVTLMAARWPDLSVTRRRMVLGVETGVTTNALAHIEKGRSDPRATTLYGLCRAFPVSSDYLLGLTADPTPRGGDLDRTREFLSWGESLRPF